MVPAEANLLAHGEAILALLAQGQFEAVATRFDRKLQESIPAPTLAQAWQLITAEAGSFRSVVARRSEPADDPRLSLVTLTCAFERGQLLACLLLDAEGHMGGLWFRANQG